MPPTINQARTGLKDEEYLNPKMNMQLIFEHRNELNKLLEEEVLQVENLAFSLSGESIPGLDPMINKDSNGVITHFFNQNNYTQELLNRLRGAHQILRGAMGNL